MGNRWNQAIYRCFTMFYLWTKVCSLFAGWWYGITWKEQKACKISKTEPWHISYAMTWRVSKFLKILSCSLAAMMFSCVVVAGGRRSADIWNTDLRPMIKLKGIRCQFFGEWSVKNRLDLFRLSSEGSKNNFLRYSSFWSLWSGVLAALVIPSGPFASQVINRNGHLPDFWILFSDTWEAQWHQNDAQ